MSNIQFIVLIGSIFLGSSLAASDEDKSIIANVIGGGLFGVVIYLKWLS